MDKFNKIIETKNVAAFIDLNDNDMESCFIELFYQHFYGAGFQNLNSIQ